MARPLKVAGPVGIEPGDHVIEGVDVTSMALLQSVKETAVHAHPTGERVNAAPNVGGVGVCKGGKVCVLHGSFLCLFTEATQGKFTEIWKQSVTLLATLCDWGLSVYFYIMELTTSDIFALLEARRKELGLSQVEVGRRAFKQNDGSALQNMKRGSSPTFENLSKLCATLGIEVLLRPRGESGPQQVIIDGSDYARIPIHDATLSAGPGATNGDASIIDHMMFRDDWLKKMGVSASKAALARVTGESMAPGIQPGDLVLIDTSKTDLPIRRRLKSTDAKAKVYAFIQDGDARVKRIERPHPGVLVLLSDNPIFPAEVVTDDRPQNISILGQVVWSGHVWR